MPKSHAPASLRLHFLTVARSLWKLRIAFGSHQRFARDGRGAGGGEAKRPREPRRRDSPWHLTSLWDSSRLSSLVLLSSCSSFGLKLSCAALLSCFGVWWGEETLVLYGAHAARGLLSPKMSLIKKEEVEVLGAEAAEPSCWAAGGGGGGSWKFSKSQNEFLNYGPHGFSPVQIFSH